MRSQRRVIRLALTVLPCAAQGAQGKAKKEARKAEQAKKQAQLNVLREARELGSPLEGLPPAFSAFKRNGVDASLEYATAKTLAQADRLAIHAILTENMAPIYGKSEWEEEAKADKEKELEEPDTRLLLVRSNADATPSAEAGTSPASSPVKQPKEEEAKAEAAKDLLGFMHYRYEIEEECLVVYIYELQVAQREDTRRKGLGKFLLLMGEMMAK